MTAELYKVLIPVRPTVAHPRYYDFQCGCLMVWLFADSIHDASDRAAIITGQLPYERFSERTKVFQVGGIRDKPELEVLARHARAMGLAMTLADCPTGSDEEGFETAILGE